MNFDGVRRPSMHGHTPSLVCQATHYSLKGSSSDRNYIFVESFPSTQVLNEINIKSNYSVMKINLYESFHKLLDVVFKKKVWKKLA